MRTGASALCDTISKGGDTYMFDSDLEVDVLALQSLSSPSDLTENELAGMGGGNTCAVTLICVALSVQVMVCCVTVACNNTVCVINTQL